MPTKKPKVNKAGYCIRYWYDGVYLVSDMIKGINYVTAHPQLFYKRKLDISITPHVRIEPDLSALVVAAMLMMDDQYIDSVMNIH
jgi:hypothetical protein